MTWRLKFSGGWKHEKRIDVSKLLKILASVLEKLTDEEMDGSSDR